jgi:hypothetical protein
LVVFFFFEVTILPSILSLLMHLVQSFIWALESPMTTVTFWRLGLNVLGVTWALYFHLFPATPRLWRWDLPMTVSFPQISQMYDMFLS